MDCGQFLTSWLGAYIHNCVAVAERRAARGTNDRVLQVRADVGIGYLLSRIFLVLQRPFLNRVVDLVQVVYAGAGLGRVPCLDEIGNRAAAGG